MDTPWRDRYEIVEELGRGGMSIVYRARDRKLERNVAVKMLHHSLAKDNVAHQRLQKEAKAVARLHHPNIVQIHDISPADSEHTCLVTELIEGETFRTWLERHGPPDLPEAAALIIYQLTVALRHAHERGVIHRDLKPENIMITRTGTLKLMDFGLAEVIGGTHRLTATGALIGSPAHMPPEVIDGEPADQRSDLFSLGTILYWSLTGRLPFEGPTPSALFHRILEGRYAPPQMYTPALGNGLTRIVEKLLQRRPEDRYSTAEEVESHLLREIHYIGWDKPASILRLLLSEPKAIYEGHKARVIRHLIRKSQVALKKGEVAQAVDDLNRCNALRPNDPQISELMSVVSRPPRRMQWARALTGSFLFTLGSIYIFWVPSPPRSISTSVRPSTNVVSTTKDNPILSSTSPPWSLEPQWSPFAPYTQAKPVAPPPRRTTPRPKLNTIQTKSRRPRALDTLSHPESFVSQPNSMPAPRVTPRVVELDVRIGQSFATVILDNEFSFKNQYRVTLKLEPGIHILEVVKPRLGHFQALKLEVTSEGRIFELQPDGTKRMLTLHELSFRIPRDRVEAFGTPRWIPENALEGRNP